jgi:hypothetical protein
MAGIDAEVQPVGEGNGEVVVDWSAAGSIPCTMM